MYCKQCGTWVEDTDTFCGECGAAVLVQTNDAADVEVAENVALDPEKKKRIAMIAGTAVAAILIVAVFVVAPALDNSESPSPSAAVEQSGSATSEDALPSPAAPTEEVDRGGYILPDSATREYSKSELSKLSNYELYIARNEIYARHGRGFKNEELARYFAEQDWYVERYSPEEFDSKGPSLNSIEKANAEMMLAIEKSRGSSYLSS